MQYDHKNHGFIAIPETGIPIYLDEIQSISKNGVVKWSKGEEFRISRFPGVRFYKNLEYEIRWDDMAGQYYSFKGRILSALRRVGTDKIPIEMVGSNGHQTTIEDADFVVEIRQNGERIWPKINPAMIADTAMNVEEAYADLIKGDMKFESLNEQEALAVKSMITDYWKAEGGITEEKLSGFLKLKWPLLSSFLMSRAKKIKEEHFNYFNVGFRRLDKNDKRVEEIYNEICQMYPTLTAEYTADLHKQKIIDFLTNKDVKPEDLVFHFENPNYIFLRSKAEEIVSALIDRLPRPSRHSISDNQKIMGRPFDFNYFLSGQSMDIYEIKWEVPNTHQERISRGLVRRVENYNPRQPDIRKAVVLVTNSSVRIPVSNIKSIRVNGKLKWQKSGDDAMNAAKDLGGIDLNSANMDLQIKRDGRGVPLPLSQQDMARLNLIQGFVPIIIEIKPAVDLPILSELKQNLQNQPQMPSTT